MKRNVPHGSQPAKNKLDRDLNPFLLNPKPNKKKKCTPAKVGGNSHIPRWTEAELGRKILPLAYPRHINQ